jgi:hypothetical protein
MYKLDWDKRCSDSGRSMFLSVSVRRFPEEMKIWISKLSKEDHPPQYVQTPSNSLKAWIEQEGRGRVNLLPLLELGYSTLVLRHWHSWFSRFLTQIKTLSAFLPLPYPQTFQRRLNHIISLRGVTVCSHGASQPP